MLLMLGKILILAVLSLHFRIFLNRKDVIEKIDIHLSAFAYICGD